MAVTHIDARCLKKPEGMAIYLCFIQHVLNSIKEGGKGAIVVPTGFLTSQSIAGKIRKYLVDNKFLSGVISMPSNIFATTGTNVSVVFIDKGGIDRPILIDASKLGVENKECKNKRTYLRDEDISKIINTYEIRESVESFSVTPSIEEIKKRKLQFIRRSIF